MTHIAGFYRPNDLQDDGVRACFRCFCPLSYLSQFLMPLQLYFAFVITRSVITRLIVLTVSQNSMVWLLSRLTLRCNTMALTVVHERPSPMPAGQGGH